MKTKISYLPQEEKQADEDLAYFLNKYPKVKVHRSERYPPRKLLYLTITTESSFDDTGQID